MGLAAGQARLLTITGRKADCEFQSMRLSHQKITLARELAEISNEYQNSLDQTKLVYDYYGTGDTSTPLSYGIMMTPSVLNDFKPILLTDSIGRSVLNSQYAAAARAAGIPQEGFGTLPSEAVRNAFVSALCNNGLITSQLATTIKSLPYNQAAGYGGGTTVAVTTGSGNIEDLLEYITGNGGTTYTVDDRETDLYSWTTDSCKNDGEDTQFFWAVQDANGNFYYNEDDDTGTGNRNTWNNSVNNHGGTKLSFSLQDLLAGSDEYFLSYKGISGEQTPIFGIVGMQKYLTSSGGFLDWLCDEFSTYLDLGDGYTSQALAYAYNSIQELILPKTQLNSNFGGYWGANWGGDTDDNSGYDDVKAYVDAVGTKTYGKGSEDEEYRDYIVYEGKDYVGFTFIGSDKGGGDDGNDHATGGINLNNIADAFLTYFADYMNGIAATDIYGNQKFNVKIGHLSSNKLASEDKNFQYTWRTGTDISSDDLVQATFYDTLFNQICMHGWVENNNVMDNEYLKEMLQTGKMYISKQKEDNYYYQANYATDTYIKEIPDESFIAQAEAKYNTEKAKLNAKEETLDLKMKNLDTEISSLTTEYDTVKNTISKNIEKSFKRYDA